MVTISVNGETRSVPAGVTLAELLQQLARDPAKCAVEVNREVVPRSEHGRYRIQDQDQVEIVTLVGGG